MDESDGADESSASAPRASAAAIENRDSKIENLLYVAVADFIRAGIVPPAARLLAENGARQNGLTGAAVGAFVERVLSTLANLTEAEAAATYGVSADEYRTWAEHCGWAAGASAPASSPFTVHDSPSASNQPDSRTCERERVAPLTPQSTTHAPAPTPSPPRAVAPPQGGSGGRPDRHLSPKHAANTANSTSDRITDSATRATTAPSPAAPPSFNSNPSTLNPAATTPATAAMPLGADAASTPEARLRALLAQLKDVRPSWFWSKRWTVSNHIVTGRRVLIATLWAAPWMYLQQHSVAFAVNAGWAIVVLVSLPWVVFRWLDHPTQGPLTLKTGVGLGIGTTVAFMLASPLSALGDWMIHGLPRTVVALASLLFTTPKPAEPAPAGSNLKSQISDYRSGASAPQPAAPPPPTAPVVFPPPAPTTVTAPERKSDVSDAADESSSRGRTPATTPQSAVRTPQLPAPPPPASSIENRKSKIENPPQFPTAPGAYALTSAGWSPLPANAVRTIALTPHAPYPEDKQPAGSTALIVAELLFSGSEPVPSIPATGATLVYVGPLSARATPPLELGPLNIGTGIARMAPLTNATGGPALGPRRVAATLEQPSTTVTILHPTGTLVPGRYALHAADQYFEVAVDGAR